jgi:actin beta/gamma 1
MEEEVTAVVIDNGSATCKSGFAGDEQPKRNDHTVVGRYRDYGIMIGLDKKETLYGEDAISKKSILNLESPIENGIIRNWEEMERLWQHIFQASRINPEEHPIFMTEAPLNPKQNRERMTQIVFEQFNAPCLYVSV